jgi:hypothetical protein
MRLMKRSILISICLLLIASLCPAFVTPAYADALPATKTMNVTALLSGVHSAADFAATMPYDDGTYYGTLTRQDSTLRNTVRITPTVTYTGQSDTTYPIDKPASGQFNFPATYAGIYFDPVSGQSFPATLYKSGAPYFSGTAVTKYLYWEHHGYQYDPENHTKLGYMSNNTTTYYSGQYRFSDPPRQPSTYYGPPAEEGLGWVQYKAPAWDGALQDSTQEPWRSLCIFWHGVARFISDTSGVQNRYRKPVLLFYRRSASCRYIYQAYTGTAVVTDTQITYSGTVSLKLPDLAITSLTTDKSTYNANETITVTAVVRNQGIVGSGASTARLTLGPHTVDRGVPALAVGATQTITYTVTALAYSSTTTLTATVTADATNTVTESNESNNSASRNITINASLPDLTITSLTTDKTAYEAGETVNVIATVRNQGYTAANSFIIRLTTNPATSIQDKTISLAANAATTLTYSFISPSYLDATNMTIQVMADASNVITESNESNNAATKIIGINALRPDLIIESANTMDWYAGKDVLISAKVTNLSAQPVPSAIIRLRAGSVTVNEAISVPGGGSNLAVFRFTVPSPPNPPGTIPLVVTITADPDNAIDETNESNNTWTKTQTVSYAPAAIVVDPDSLALEQDSVSRNGVSPSLPQFTPSIYHTWQEVRLVNGSYTVKTFWTQLTTIFSISPDPRIAYPDNPGLMESGFGVQATCKTTLTTNYDHPEKLIGPQMVWVYAPDSSYGQGQWQNVRDSLVSSSGSAGDKTIQWQYGVNPYSTTSSRLHYTPLWFPDGQYMALAQAFYAWSPVGQMVGFETDSVTILGDMYDRITAVRR